MQGRTSPIPHMLLAWMAGAFVAGVIASSTLESGAWPLAVALAAACGALGLARRSRTAALYAVLLPACLIAGTWREVAADRPLADDDVAHYSGTSMRLRGVVRDDPHVSDTSQRFAMEVASARVDGAWRAVSGGVQVRAPLLPRHRPGDVLEIEGEIEHPPVLKGLDYAGLLARRGISAVVDYPQTRTIGREEPPHWRGGILRARRELSRGIELALPEPEASLAKGVLLGERAALPPALQDDLNATSTSHLVVVSGSNVVLLSSFCAMVLGGLFGRRRALWLSLAAVAAYATLVGPSPPVVRAAIMGGVVIGAGVSGRRTNGVTSLIAAAAVMVGVDPPVLRDVSFQLSVGATAGILLLGTPFRRRVIDALGWLLRRDEVPRWAGGLIADPAAVTLAATVATAPLIALHFGRVSLVALPANMAIVPAFPLLLAASAVAAIGGALPLPHVAFGAPAYALLAYWGTSASWFAALPGASVALEGYTAPWFIVTAALLGAALVAGGRLLGAPPRATLAPSRPFAWRDTGRRALYAAPVAGLLISSGWIATGSGGGRLQVTVLDVGQGDAILIETPSGQDVLVDGGPGGAVLRGLDAAMAWHDRSLDLVVMTHPQADHAAGLVDVLHRYDVRSFASGGAPTAGPLGRALADGLREEGVASRSLAAGDRVDLGDGVRLDVLWPPSGSSIEGNNSSVVLRLAWHDVSFLLSGDIEAAAERELVATGAPLRSTVLKVAHHGSATSSGAAFLEAVAPRAAVISAGAGNRFGHPTHGVIERLAAFGVTFVTANDGAVQFETDGTRVWIEAGR